MSDTTRDSPAFNQDKSSVPQSSRQQVEAGEYVLAHAAHLAQLGWGNRLVAAYALGSLAHGGFSTHVSDVDLGLVIEDPLEDSDITILDGILSELRADAIPLAERLSVFWGSLATMSGIGAGGRFPPLDLLDLKQSGRLLAGRDIRSRVRTPALRELIVSGAAFALRVLSTTQTMAYLRNPTELVNAGARKLTKLVLYPVRFLYTAQTGQVGVNHKAVEHFSAVTTGMSAVLARSALEWRKTPPDPGDGAIAEALRKGLLPLYRVFLEDYERRLRGYGELDLAQAYSEWRQQLT
jgi:hypothetical protein